MTPFPLHTPIGVAMPIGPTPQEHAQRRIDAVKKITDALFEYFTLQERETIRFHNENPEAFKPYRPSVEMLTKAWDDVRRIESQIEILKETGEDLPEDQYNFLRAISIIPMEQQLEQATEWAKNLQTQIETAEKQEPLLPPTQKHE